MPNPAVEEYGKIVEALRTAVRSPETADPVLLADDAAQYSEACAEVNERIRNSHALLAKGLRVEAIQHSKVDPDALDMIAILDFPESDAWRQLVQFWQWPPPPDLHLSMAVDLNEAYSDLQDMNPLLRKYRQLNLSRAPKEDRATVLRQLLEMDRDNHLWREGIMQIEAVRLADIEADMDAAYKRHDSNRINALFAEIHQQQWVTPIPSTLSHKIDQYHSSIHADEAKTDLEHILRDWEAACQDQDRERGSHLRSKWKDNEPRARLTPNDELSQRAQRLLDWMAEADADVEIQKLTVDLRRRLNSLLDHRADPAEIDKVAGKIERAGGKLTPDVKRRIKEAHDRVAASVRNRMIAIVVGAIILVLLMLGIFALLIFRDLKSAENQGIYHQRYAVRDGESVVARSLPGVPVAAGLHAEDVRNRGVS
jgi:hypothetical protein